MQSLGNFLRLNAGSVLSAQEIERMVRNPRSERMAEKVCMNQKSREQVRCEIAAKTLAELKGCTSR